MKNAEWLTNIIEDIPPNPPELNFDPENDLKVLMFTGGTTGHPKGCMLSHKNVTANAIQNSVSQSHLAEMIKEKAFILNGLPLYHT